MLKEEVRFSWPYKWGNIFSKTEDASGDEMWAEQILNIGETVIKNWEYQWTMEAWCYLAKCLIPNGI